MTTLTDPTTMSDANRNTVAASGSRELVGNYRPIGIAAVVAAAAFVTRSRAPKAIAPNTPQGALALRLRSN